MLKRQKIISSLVLIAASAVGLIYCIRNIGETTLSIHPLFLPSILFGALCLLSVIRLYSGVRMKPEEDEKHDIHVPKKSLLTMVLIVAYALLFKPLGYVVDTFLYLVIQMLLLKDGKKNYALIALIAVIGSVGVYALFVYGFNVMLPPGVLNHLF